MKRDELKISKGVPIPPRVKNSSGWPIRSPITKALMKMVTGDSIDILLSVSKTKASLIANVKQKAKQTKSKIIYRLHDEMGKPLLNDKGEPIIRVWKLKQLP
jgi:hypothetical protein